MSVSVRPRPKYVIGPDGSPLTIADLPKPGTKRWVIRRKAVVIAAVRGGLLTLEEACSRYVPGGSYEITKRLPENNGEFEYRIKSMNEPHERVARESELTTL